MSPTFSARLACLLLIAVAASAGHAEDPGETPTGTLSGRVTDATTGKPLSNATVQVQGMKLVTTTSADGRFTLKGAPGAQLTLAVTYLGYEPALRRLDRATVASGRPLQIALQPTVLQGEEVVITASRYGTDVHLSQTNIPAAEIRRRNADADIPILLEDIPGVFASSDAGNGVGYTYLNIRGFDQRRVGVMINGIPLNDPEDHQVYWVDMPDLVSSLEDIQVQRGITNSLGGMTAIGGTVNLITDVLEVEPQGRLQIQTGSYGTAKQSLAYQSGLLDGRLATSLRISHLESDGYRQRAGSDQWGIFWSGQLNAPDHRVQVNVYTGREVTHHAWDGIDEATLARDRTANPETYHNAIDDFRQPHYELHHTWTISSRVALKHALYLIHGEGFYENFKADRTARDFSLDVLLGTVPDAEVDLVRRKWVRKDQVGWVPQLMVEHSRGRLLTGGDWYTFHSNHWGEVIAVEGYDTAEFTPPLKYADYTGDKQTVSAYVNERLDVGGGLTLLLDLQYQRKTYDFMQNPSGNFRWVDARQPEMATRNAFSVDYAWFNPKGGLHWRTPARPWGGELGVYAHVGVAHREPSDADYFDAFQDAYDLGARPLFRTYRAVTSADGAVVEYLDWSDPLVHEERVVNYETGFAWRGENVSLTVNGYRMDFTNEIVPYGGVDEDGAGIKGNAGKTLHRGIEVGLTARLSTRHSLNGAVSRSWNEFAEFIFTDWDGTRLDYAGNPIALFPDHQATAGLRSDWGGWDTSLRVRRVGRQHLDNSGIATRTIDPYTVVDIGAAWNLSRLGGAALAGARLELRVRNLLDEKYETSGYYDGWGAGNYKIPAAERNFLVGVEYVF